ncbi:MAG: response regulator [Candidatus Omnitrophica bacterium]|nr:response regulator [Candidatus Omnitrophota bacterium]
MAKILVADDEVDVGMIVSERLRRGGHEVVWAADGNIAVKMLEEFYFDLAILDVRMPGRDGYTVCRWIRNSPEHKTMPILLMSAFFEEHTQWKQSQADFFLPKPFEGLHLLEVVKRLLEQAPPRATHEKV